MIRPLKIEYHSGSRIRMQSVSVDEIQSPKSKEEPYACAALIFKIFIKE